MLGSGPKKGSNVSNCFDCDIQIDWLNNFNGRCGKCHAVYLEASSKGKSVEDLRVEKENTRRKEANAVQRNYRRTNAIRNITLTTETAHNLPVVSRLSIVTAEVVVGMNIFKDAMTGVRNIVGGRTGNIQNALKDMREKALSELRMEAATLEADAVVGVNLDYNEIGATGSTMLMLVASGTAVKLEPDL